MLARTEPACLVIADIAGYSSYLAGVELDHAQDILGDLIDTVVGALRPAFKLAKLEGDAASFSGGPGGCARLLLGVPNAGSIDMDGVSDRSLRQRDRADLVGCEGPIGIEVRLRTSRPCSASRNGWKLPQTSR